jgi:CheY-like chemotaxis protein/PAS domain-containing protein
MVNARNCPGGSSRDQHAGGREPMQVDTGQFVPVAHDTGHSYNSAAFRFFVRSFGLASPPKTLYIRTDDERDASLIERLAGVCEVVEVDSPMRALALLRRGDFAGLYVGSSHLADAVQLGRLLQNERILEGMPDGVALLDRENSIVWANERLRQWCGRDDMAGTNFYSVFGAPEILGPDFCPFHTALATGRASNSTLRADDNKYFEVHAAPIHEIEASTRFLIVTVRDVSAQMHQQQKLQAIHRAGVELADLTPEEVFHMELEERRELLKANILHYTKDLLNFEVMEVRLLRDSGELVKLLSVGIDEEASRRPLFAQPQGNGVTGFVAATGKSYLCEDTAEDPLYIQGFKGAKSSLTVPLILHDEVIGTFNVESPEPHAFTESDLQFLEIFSRDVAAALNTLELLVAQHANTAQASVEAIHGAVALPVDEILNDAVNVMERYIGHEPEVNERLQRILQNARDIKQVIQKVGQKLTPSQAVPQSAQIEERPKLHGRRILVVDEDESVRSAAHALMERYGCIVETAHAGAEALLMVRPGTTTMNYDVIIAAIRLPDITGYELLLKLKEILERVPLVLMTGFGYDPSHTIVKARQAGLASHAVLYKPFRLDQLLATIEALLDSHRESHQVQDAPA